MLYPNDDVQKCFAANLKKAKEQLGCITANCDKEPNFTGLSGWVFEQTIQYCVRKELEARQIKSTIREQVKLGQRSRTDLSIDDRIAIELKVRGLFSGKDFERYGCCKELAQAQGFQAYLYLTLGETYGPYQKGITEALGETNAFFLDRPGDWERFINRLVEILQTPSKA